MHRIIGWFCRSTPSLRARYLRDFNERIAGSDVSGSILSACMVRPCCSMAIATAVVAFAFLWGNLAYFLVCFLPNLYIIYAHFVATADGRSTLHVSLERPMQISAESRSHIDHGRIRGGRKRPRTVSTRLLISRPLETERFGKATNGSLHLFLVLIYDFTHWRAALM